MFKNTKEDEGESATNYLFQKLNNKNIYLCNGPLRDYSCKKGNQGTKNFFFHIIM